MSDTLRQEPPDTGFQKFAYVQSPQIQYLLLRRKKLHQQDIQSQLMHLATMIAMRALNLHTSSKLMTTLHEILHVLYLLLLRQDKKNLCCTLEQQPRHCHQHQLHIRNPYPNNLLHFSQPQFLHQHPPQPEMP